MLKLLKKEIKEHKRVIFDGDNYSPEWHKEAAKRGLPIMADSVAAYPILKSKKTVDLFKAYGVLNKAEVDSRFHISVEKYVKQMGIEADTAVNIARTMVLPAALQHQELLAGALSGAGGGGGEVAGAEEGAGGVRGPGELAPEGDGEAGEGRGPPQRRSVQACAAHQGDVKPAMAELRETVDTLETWVSSELWPLPTYQDMLFLE